MTLRIPPLRDRRDDIPRLAEHYLILMCREHGREAKRFSREALAALSSYAWPGNVRELRNAVESVVIFHRGEVVRVGDLPPEIQACAEESEQGEPAPEPETAEEGLPPADEAAARRPTVFTSSFSGAAHTVEAPRGTKTMDEIERDAILAALERTGGRRVEAAKLLDIGLRTLQRKLKDYKDQGYYQE